MSISISQIAAASARAEADNLQAFRAFIAVSKALKGAVSTEQHQAAAHFNQLQAALDSLQQPVAANDLALIAVLETDQPYNKALDAVTLPAADFNQPALILAYQQAFLQRVDQTMAQHTAGADNTGSTAP